MNKQSIGMIVGGIFLVLGITGCGKDAKLSPSNGDARLKVQGNHIVDMSGKEVVLKGLNIGYPSTLLQKNHWSVDYFRKAAEWGARCIRIPIDPGSYRSAGKDSYFEILDTAVKWCKENDMYAIVDWHSIGNIVQQLFNPPYEEDYRTNMAEMKEFWSSAAKRYRNEPWVAFYEIFNEPAAIEWEGGSLTWPEWRDRMDSIIDVIYANNPDAIPMIGGLNYAYDLKGVASAPLRNKGIVFAVHPYPGRASEPWEENWETDFGYLAKDYPMFLTEFGFDPNDTFYPPVFKADTNYGARILAFAKNRNISWAAFVFFNDPVWPMPLFTDWNYTPSQSGSFFKKMLLAP
jgi:endoglucanase